MFKKQYTKLKSYFSKTETKSTAPIPIRSGSVLEHILTGNGIVTSSQAMRFYQDNSAIATAVDMIACAFEQITPILQDQEDNFVDNQDITEFLKNPNGFETWKEFAGAISRHYLLTHDSHISALGIVNREPIEMYAIKPQNVSTVEDVRDSYPGQYIVPFGAGHGTYSRDNSQLGTTRFYDGPLKELYHIMGFSSQSTNIQGDSPLNAALLEARQQIESKTHNLKVIQNGGRLSLIVSFKDESRIDDDEHLERKTRVRESLQPGGIAVVSGPDMSIQEASQNTKDMDFAKLDEISAQAIYLRYKIPLPLVTTTASTFNNMETAVLMLYDQAVIPHAETILGGLSKFLLPRYRLDPSKFKLGYDPNSITALRERMLKEISDRAKTKIETINELRALLPDRDDKEGGDVLYQNANEIPLGTDLTDNNDNNNGEEVL